MPTSAAANAGDPRNNPRGAEHSVQSTGTVGGGGTGGPGGSGGYSPRRLSATKAPPKEITVSSLGETTSAPYVPPRPMPAAPAPAAAAPTPAALAAPSPLSWDGMTTGLADTPTIGMPVPPAPTARRYRVPSAARVASAYGFVG